MASETRSKRAKPASGNRSKAALAGTGTTQPVYAGSKSELAGTGTTAPSPAPSSGGSARSPQSRARARGRRTRAILASNTSRPQKRSQAPPKLPKTHPLEAPPTFKGAKTAGTPTLSELSKAQQSGTLKVNKSGFLTTPKIRRVAGKVRRLKAKAGKGGLTGPLVPQQKRFVEGVAKRTHLSPRAVAAQALAEESGPAASGREAEGEHNYLNIGPGQHFGSNREAVGQTAHLLNTSPSYAGIRASRGTGARNQIQAIAASPWGTVGSTMQGTLPQVGYKRNPKVAAKLQRAEAQAKELGLSTGGKSAGPAPKQVVTRFKAIKKAAAALTKRHIPYVWGGGHGGFEANPQGLDCSGAVSWVLHKAGVLSSPLTSGSMGSVLKPGPGAVTVFYNAEHTFMRIGNEYWGTSVGDSGAGGLGPHPTPSASYLAQYSVGHVAGLGKKQALQMGFHPGEALPGMTLSSGGSTATITPSAGVVKQKAGFSKQPITLSQSVHRTEAKLKALSSAPAPKAESSPSSVTLADLERKYGKSAA